jgi:hypothetical protein
MPPAASSIASGTNRLQVRHPGKATSRRPSAASIASAAPCEYRSQHRRVVHGSGRSALATDQPPDSVGNSSRRLRMAEVHPQIVRKNRNSYPPSGRSRPARGIRPAAARWWRPSHSPGGATRSGATSRSSRTRWWATPRTARASTTGRWRSGWARGGCGSSPGGAATRRAAGAGGRGRGRAERGDRGAAGGGVGGADRRAVRVTRRRRHRTAAAAPTRFR